MTPPDANAPWHNAVARQVPWSFIFPEMDFGFSCELYQSRGTYTDCVHNHHHHHHQNRSSRYLRMFCSKKACMPETGAA